MDEHRGGLLTAGGILSIIVGALDIVGAVGVIGGGAAMFLTSLNISLMLLFLPLLEHVPQLWLDRIMAAAPTSSIVIAGILLVLGIVAIVGGVSAVRRKSFGLSLAGVICALISPFQFLLGLLAVIFVALGKREF